MESSRAGIGSLLWAGIEGTGLTAAERDLLRDWAVNGVVLFRQNLISLQQSRRLVAELKAASPEMAFFSVDQEGGRVTRLPAPATSFPSAMALAATGDPSLAEAAARATGRELRAFGVTVNLAPVLDVNVNPLNPSVGTRSFGDRPEIVATFGAAQVRGYLAGGVLPVAKHFPGHGRTPVDPHLDLPVLDDSLAELQARDLPPFVAAVGAGVPAVMMGHMAYPTIDPSALPATLSPVMIGLLRNELGFRGLVVTDALRMQAVADRWGMVEASIVSIEAGADVALPLRDEGAVLEGLLAAARSGRLPSDRLAAAHTHLAEARRLLAELPDADPSAIAWDEHAELARMIARQAMTIVRDERGWLPLRRQASTLVVEFHVSGMSQVEEGEQRPSVLLERVRRFAPDARGVVLPAGQVTASDRARVIAAAREATQVIVGTREALIHSAQAALVLDLLDLGRPVVVTALRSPTDLAAFPEAPGYLAVLSDVPASLDACAETLFGELRPSGTVPVDLTALSRSAAT